MKWCLCTIVLLVALMACSQPVASPTPVPQSTAEPTVIAHEMQERATPTQSISQSSARVFDVYLVKEDISPPEMANANLAELELEQTPFLSIDDIVAYRSETHEMELTRSASQRVAWFERSALSLGGAPFVICAGGEPIYGGALWTSYSSATYDGIVIDLYPAESGQPLPIRLGYPSPEWFTGEDLRSDPRIYRSLEGAGKLK
jgi:hypothetical protein